MTWRRLVASPSTSTGSAAWKVHRPLGPDGGRVLTASAHRATRSTGPPLHRPALVQPGQEQQVGDQLLHPRGLATDPPHQALQVLGFCSDAPAPKSSA